MLAWPAPRSLTDDDIEAMLVASRSHSEAEEVVGQVIQEFRLSMRNSPNLSV